jgi:hypothetical protein
VAAAFRGAPAAARRETRRLGLTQSGRGTKKHGAVQQGAVYYFNRPNEQVVEDWPSVRNGATTFYAALGPARLACESAAHCRRPCGANVRTTPIQSFAKHRGSVQGTPASRDDLLLPSYNCDCVGPPRPAVKKGDFSEYLAVRQSCEHARPTFWRSNSDLAFWPRYADLDCATQHDHHAVAGRSDHEYGFASRKITNSDASEKCFFFLTLEVAKQHTFAEKLADVRAPTTDPASADNAET